MIKLSQFKKDRRHIRRQFDEIHDPLRTKPSRISVGCGLVNKYLTAAATSVFLVGVINATVLDRPDQNADVDAATLSRDYANNELDAQSKYGGKTITVRGNVVTVTRNKIGKPFIALNSAGSNKLVFCLFEPAAENQLRQLRVGSRIAVHGVISHYRIQGGVELENCSL